MAFTNTKTLNETNQVPPIVGELEAIFRALPDEELIARLRGPKRRGPHGYNPVVLWRCFITYYYLGLPSVSDFIRIIHDNPHIASVCSIKWPLGIPSQPTFSRFQTRLIKQGIKEEVNRIFQKLSKKLQQTLPDYAKSVAIDATDLKAWSNGGHRTPTDKDAGWVIKTDTNGRGKFTWGYKLSLMVDTTYEQPVAFKVTSGNVGEIRAAPTLLSQARWINNKFHPKYVIADAGYSSERFRRLIRRQYRAIPIIKTNPAHKKAMSLYPETDLWEAIYNRRNSTERVFSRLKNHRKLNLIRVRGIRKVRIHCLLCLIVLQAQAFATGSISLTRSVN
jgi:transposase